MVFVGFGWLIGPDGLAIVHLEQSHGAIRVIAEITLPMVLIFAIWAGAPRVDGASGSELPVFALLQILSGPVAGAVVGTIGALAINRARDRRSMTQPFEGIAILSIAALTFAGAELIGGNCFIAAFDARIREKCYFLLKLMETEDQILTLITF